MHVLTNAISFPLLLAPKMGGIPFPARQRHKGRFARPSQARILDPRVAAAAGSAPPEIGCEMLGPGRLVGRGALRGKLRRGRGRRHRLGGSSSFSFAGIVGGAGCLLEIECGVSPYLLVSYVAGAIAAQIVESAESCDRVNCLARCPCRL